MTVAAVSVACTLALATAGCNAVFGLRETGVQDSSVIIIDPTGDGPNARPIVPPDGQPTCGGAPDFESWTYEPRPLPYAGQVGTFGLYATSTGMHVVLTPTTGTGIWDVDLAASSSTEIESLRPPANRSISSVAVSPDGAAIWFKIEETTYVGFRTLGFTRQATDLGLASAYEVLPGSPGFYDGTLRMIARVRDTSASQTAYVELASSNGLTWTRGQTLPFGGVGYYNANLSADGCTLVFARMEGGSAFVLYRSQRTSSGAFDAPIKLVAASAISTSTINPAVAPDLASLWFSSIGAQSLYEGHP